MSYEDCKKAIWEVIGTITIGIAIVLFLWFIGRSVYQTGYADGRLFGNESAWKSCKEVYKTTRGAGK